MISGYISHNFSFSLYFVHFCEIVYIIRAISYHRVLLLESPKKGYKLNSIQKTFFGMKTMPKHGQKSSFDREVMSLIVPVKAKTIEQQPRRAFIAPHVAFENTIGTSRTSKRPIKRILKAYLACVHPLLWH